MKSKKQLAFIGSLLTLMVAISCSSFEKSTEAKTTMDLSGKWRFQIDSLDVGEDQKWYSENLTKTIQLPGSMVENEKGNAIDLQTKWTGNLWNDSLWYKSPKYAEYRQPGNTKISFWLQPEKKYYGAAWYQKTVEIPAAWEDNVLEFSIERAHWESTLWLDGKKIAVKNTLGTAHKYILKNITPGTHTLTVRMDNRIKDINVGLDAHSITDNTQTNWNGLVGDLSFTAKPRVYLESARIYPDVKNKKVSLKVQIENTTREATTAKIMLRAKGYSEGSKSLSPFSKSVKLKSGTNEIMLDYEMGPNPALWDEFDPNLYEMQISLKLNNTNGELREVFGMRDFKAAGTRFVINESPVFLRGTLECSIFPLTGYPPTDVKSWARIFNIIKSHGLNHMRFHSWCPPEAAFKAADEAGVYVQVEASAWASIGDGAPVDEWLYKEGEAILKAYGNHPSFVMMAYGNEPSGENHTAYLVDYVDHFKALDRTKMYTSAAGWPYIDNADFYNTAAPRIQHWNENLNSVINFKAPQTVFDYQDLIDRTPKPVVSHEIGQWCVYPNFKEMSKYTGVLKPKNFEIFQETLVTNSMGALADSLMLASGKLQTLCYKADIEAALRTKGFAGFQLLDLHDFPGQGTALVGVLDAFWDEKGYVSPEEFKSFSGQTVPLARLKQRTFLNTDTLTATIELAHFGSKPLKGITPTWKVLDKNAGTFASGTFGEKELPVDNGTALGSISLPLEKISIAQKLTLSVQVGEYTNQWDIWVYPAKKKENFDAVRVVEKLDAATVAFLENGGTVLLNGTKGSVAPEKGGKVGIGFSSIFWNTSWTKGQEPHTLGILCDPKHPALASFPTEYHSNWQWWDAMSHSDAIILDDFSPDLKPIVRVIDDWFENRRLALLFEARVGKGKLLVSGIDLHTDLDTRIEAQQLLYSLQKYMTGDQFNPKQELNIQSIKGIYASN